MLNDPKRQFLARAVVKGLMELYVKLGKVEAVGGEEGTRKRLERYYRPAEDGEEKAAESVELFYTMVLKRFAKPLAKWEEVRPLPPRSPSGSLTPSPIEMPHDSHNEGQRQPYSAPHPNAICFLSQGEFCGWLR